MKKQDVMCKRVIPDDVFNDTLNNICTAFYISSYYLEPFDIMPFQIYTLKKEHIDCIFSAIENSENEKILRFMYSYEKDGRIYRDYDLTDNAFQLCNLLCGITRDGIESYILTEKEAFEYYKRILRLYARFHKFALAECKEYSKNDKTKPENRDWEKTLNLNDSFFSERYFSTIPLMGTKYFSAKEYVLEVEKIIEEDIDLFTEYYFVYKTGLCSHNYIADVWQKNYPFSDEFVSRNYKYFYVPSIIYNKKCTENKQQLEIIFGKMLEWNLSEVVRVNSFGGEFENFKIDKEKIDELILLFVANN